jgi:hypothetical protein
VGQRGVPFRAHDASSITANAAGVSGGGIYLSPVGGTVDLAVAGSVHDNLPDNCFPAGGVTGCSG